MKWLWCFLWAHDVKELKRYYQKPNNASPACIPQWDYQKAQFGCTVIEFYCQRCKRTKFVERLGNLTFENAIDETLSRMERHL